MQATVFHENIQVFCSSLSVLHFIILIVGSKLVKVAQKFCIFLKFLTLEEHWYRVSEYPCAVPKVLRMTRLLSVSTFLNSRSSPLNVCLKP